MNNTKTSQTTYISASEALAIIGNAGFMAHMIKKGLLIPLDSDKLYPDKFDRSQVETVRFRWELSCRCWELVKKPIEVIRVDSVFAE